jgi:hypothetical protein
MRVGSLEILNDRLSDFVAQTSMSHPSKARRRKESDLSLIDIEETLQLWPTQIGASAKFLKKGQKLDIFIKI